MSRKYIKKSDERKKNEIRSRIKSIEEGIAKANEYLETDKHADWRGFRPYFRVKIRNNKIVPPHKDWIRNVYIPRLERSLKTTEKLLDRFELD